MSAFIRCQPTFALGHQHDAQEALSLILDRTGLDEACFQCGRVGAMNPVRDSDVVLLDQFGRGGALARLLTAPTIDMKALLVACLGQGDRNLHVVPDILGVRFLQHRDDAGEDAEDEEFVWV